MLKTLIRLFIIAGCLMTTTAYADNIVSWQEEVKLSDGRIIVGVQKRLCQGAYTGGNYASCIGREAWLTINLPEFSPQPIVWHERLLPMILNMDAGRLYVVGYPPTEREFDLYGKPQPIYIGFLWDSGKWKRIPFKEIPEAIYDTNLLIQAIPPKGTRLLTLPTKGSRQLNNRPTITKDFKRIDPVLKTNFN